MTTGPKISQVHTTCRRCVFADFENKKQVGCRLNKLQDYRNANIKIVEVYDDEGYEFNLIDGRFCLFYRNEKVMEQYPKNSWVDIVKTQTKVPYQLIIFFEKDDTIQTIKRIIKEIKQQDIQPVMVSVINKQYIDYAQEPEKYVKPSLLLDILNDSSFHKFSLKNVYDSSLTDRDLIDLVFDNTKAYPYPFYVVFRASFSIPQQFSKEFNDSILIKMLQIGFASPIDDKLNGMIVNRTTHKKYAGNSFGVFIEQKLKNFEENAHNFIYKVEDICPSLKLK